MCVNLQFYIDFYEFGKIRVEISSSNSANTFKVGSNSNSSSKYSIISFPRKTFCMIAIGCFSWSHKHRHWVVHNTHGGSRARTGTSTVAAAAREGSNQIQDRSRVWSSWRWTLFSILVTSTTLGNNITSKY